MITKTQALVHKQFTHVSRKNKDGTPVRIRATGKCKTWKTRPDDFQLPVKYGMYENGYLTPDNAHEWVVAGHEGLTEYESAVMTDEYLERRGF